MKNLLNQVLSGEITGFNLFSEELDEDRQSVIYGHSELGHLSLLLKELRKGWLLTEHLLTKRETVYLWDARWAPSKNTRIASLKKRVIAVESGFLLKFFPSKNLAKPLINFLIDRCYKDGSDSIVGSWETPYIATNNIKHPEFIATKELILRGKNKAVQSSFVPKKFKTRFAEIKQKLLFRPFAEFVGA